MNDSLGNAQTMRTPGPGRGGDFALRAGEILGPYRIVRPLGRGGMGEVYLAEHAQLGTRIALKIIRREFAADPGFVDRFRREARFMARLKHSNIVPCRDAGLDRGMPWLAMDYIEGPRGQPMDLFELLAERRESGKLFDEDEAIAVGLQICDALAYAHSYRDDEVPAGILHRDLKPGNILVGPDTRLYVADFGLARIMGRRFEKSVIEQSLSGLRSLGDLNTMGAAKVATSSDRVGTFDYMSPEQREGKEADARSDVFALGAILYELLTGRKVAGVPMRPSKARPGLNSVWDDIVYERCLTADPSGRFSSAAELKAAILAATAVEQPAPSVPPSGGEGTHRAAKAAKGRERAWIGYVIGAALLVIVILGVIPGMRSDPGSQPETYESTRIERMPPPAVTPPTATDVGGSVPNLDELLGGSSSSVPAAPPGAIRVLATVPPEAEAHFRGLEKRIRAGSRRWKVASALPLVVTGIPSGNVDVELEALGYETTEGPRSVATVSDATSDVTFALSPRPANLTVSCNAPDATVKIGAGGPSVRLAGQPVEIPALQEVRLSVAAPGYEPETVTLGAMDPGGAYMKDVQMRKMQIPNPTNAWRAFPAISPAKVPAGLAELLGASTPSVSPSQRIEAQRERERVERLAKEKEGLVALAAGLEALRGERYQVAYDKFGVAFSNIAVREATREARERAQCCRAEAAYGLAEEAWRAGKRDAAIAWLVIAEEHPLMKSSAKRLRDEIEAPPSSSFVPSYPGRSLRGSGLIR